MPAKAAIVQPPSGTVTFLFTDVEGSTRLWQEHSAEMSVALARHDDIVRSAVGVHGGYVFSTAGDAFAVAFDECGAAVTAAIDVQRALQAEGWPAGAALRVRICEGKLRLPNALFDQLLDLCGADISNRGLTAVYLDGAKVGRDLLLCSFPEPSDNDPNVDDMIRCRVDGKIRIRTATVGGSVNCSYAQLVGGAKDGLVFDAQNATVVAAVSWKGVDLGGDVSLEGTTAGVLNDDRAGWGIPACRWTLDRFTYSGVRIDDPSWAWKARKQWIDRQPVYSSTPYQQLAKVYSEAGADSAARKILLEQFRAQVKREDGGRTWFQRLWHRFLNITIGHGYAPWRVLYFVAALWLAGTIAYTMAAHGGWMVPTKSPSAATAGQTLTGGSGTGPAALTTTATTNSVPGPSPLNCGRRDVPCLVPAVYSLDELLPVVNLGQRDNWHPVGPLVYRATGWILILSGWLLTSLVVAGFTSIVRRN